LTTLLFLLDIDNCPKQQLAERRSGATRTPLGNKKGNVSMKGKKWRPRTQEKTETPPSPRGLQLLLLLLNNEKIAGNIDTRVRLLIGAALMQASYAAPLRLLLDTDSLSGSVTPEMEGHLQSELLETVNHLRSLSAQARMLTFTLMASPLITASDVHQVAILNEVTLLATEFG
jgi:hypothetical protein